MRYNRLGSTGLYVSELALGTMTFGGQGVFGQMGDLQQEGAQGLVERALAAGVNLIDTADAYSAGLSETITGQALRSLGVKRDEIVLATKAFTTMGRGPNTGGLSRAHLNAALEASLERLGVDFVDLYQVHAFDPATPIEETVVALGDLVREGLVRYVGVSNWSAWQIMKALGVAERRGVARFESLQAYYSLAGRDLERELAPMLVSEGIGLLVWSPLAGGMLSGRVDRDAAPEGGTRRATLPFPPVDLPRTHAVVDALRIIAKRHETSVPRVALAWLLHQPHVTSVIVGARRLDQLDDNLAACEIQLDARELQVIDEASRLPPEYPGWMHATMGGDRLALREKGAWQARARAR